ncbi:hypothetical protein [Flavobacterium sp. SORGH_AS_0622]|uniref:hypothetical protein n=1 Tax=Flavobacterium sp. SORGH_AS_0622 TaxID=3041772 RepID=UPI0027835074|nr:hypothetical protein [Flavobacterium sp. SORGH_AS_0622]MDQ1165697.1 putative transcriptional regulator [Flavobacterium sp. SORGH_AS_0622]
MNYNNAKHKVLKLFVKVKLDYIEEYHLTREFYLTIDEVVKKEKLSYDVAKLILASLLANEEIKFNNSIDEDGYSGYAITNKGVFAYEDKKYLRIRIERSRSSWSFIISIVSFLISLVAILLTICEPEKEEQANINRNEVQKGLLIRSQNN